MNKVTDHEDEVKIPVFDELEYQENSQLFISEQQSVIKILTTSENEQKEGTASDSLIHLASQMDHKDFKNNDDFEMEIQNLTDLETAIQCVGSFGIFQKYLAAFLWFLVSPFLAFIIYGNMLILLTPEHWCQVPEIREYGLTPLQRKTLSIPVQQDEGINKFSQCGRYSTNFTQVHWSNLNGTLPRPSPDWEIMKCQKTWEYDYDLVYPTMTSEGNWVCDDAWKTYLVYTVFWTGASLGVVILGFVADNYGRVPVVVFGHLLCALSGIATNFVSNYKLFLVVRFIVGFFTISQSMTSYVLVMEYVGTKHRLIVSIGYLYVYPLVGCILPWFAYLVRDWKIFNFSTSVPLLVVPLLYKFIPESLRWMIAKGQHVRAKQMLCKVAKRNKKIIPDGFLEKLKFLDENESKMGRKSIFDLFQLQNLKRVFVFTNISWLTLSTCFTGGYIHAATISDNPFLMITVNSGLDILANAVAGRLAAGCGRRATSVYSCFLASLAYVCSAILSKGSFIAETAALMVARLLVTVGYNVNYLYAAEVYPTVIRTQALAIRQAIGSAGNFLSPQIVALALYAKFIPLLVFGVLSAVAALVMTFLPETSNTNLPETLEDGEALARFGKPVTSLLGTQKKKLHKLSGESNIAAKKKNLLKSPVITNSKVEKMEPED